jgi:type I restriction enzyme S subunit
MSWDKVRLGDAFEFIRNGASIKQTDGMVGTPITRIETIANSILDESRLGYADIDDDKFSDYYLRNGDILMSHINSWAHLGKCAIVEGDKKIIHGMNLLLLRTDKQKLDSKYAKYYFQSDGFISQLHRISNQSVNQSSFAVTKLKELEIPLPPLEIQQRIAEILDKADALRRKDQQLLAKYDELAQAIFIDMFGDPVKNERGWEVKKLGELGKLDRGVSKHRPRNAPQLLGGIYPLVQTGDVANSNGVITNYRSTYSEIGLKQSKLWPKGTLCITIAANIAKTGVLNFDACFPDSIVGFVPNEGETNTLYIQFWLSFLQKMLEETAPESAQKNINLDILRNLEVINPPFEEQEKFKVILENAYGIRENLNKNLEISNSLFQSLLQKAFKGELDVVPDKIL